MLELTLKDIIISLFTYAQIVTGTTGLDLTVPEISMVPQQTIAQKACGTQSCNVKGWFSNENGMIYMPDTSDILHNQYAQSILLHEIVHSIQHRIDKPKLGNDCLTWKVREAEAYRIQYEWLYENRIPVRPLSLNLLAAGFRSIECPLS